ncbi:MAG: histidine kinase [Vallitaleaceae bacterium]|nr:histidine kinase [Vallitaleaceae bacterium]
MKNKEREFLNIPFHHSLKGKLLAYTLLVLLLMSALSVYSLMITGTYRRQVDTMFNRNIRLNELKQNLEEVNNELVVYLSTKSSTSLNNFMMFSDELQALTTEIIEDIHIYNEEELMLMDIRNMVFRFLEKANQAVSEKRKSDVTSYTQRYNNSLQIREYINQYIDELNIRQLDSNAQKYIYMTKQIKNATLLNSLLIVNIIVLSLFIMIKVTNRMINPILSLTQSALHISKGEFQTQEVVVHTNDEIQILASAFDTMKSNIYTYIEELKEKAETEAKLNFQQLENLRMQALLENARLYALQSQMNPHFLFNSINAGVQLSMMEGAEKTSEFLESMSRLFRYNIGHIDEAVTIGQEIENIKDYFELLKVRFGDLICFHCDIEEACLEDSMPPLIVQPLVENAYLHGLSKKEEGGNIWLRVHYHEQYSEIQIEDDGVGMGQEKKEASNGIGLKNVIERMELFYKEKDLVKIHSELGCGTIFILHIPHKRRVYVKSHDC